MWGQVSLVLQAVSEELERAVVELAGARYERKAADQPLRRWGPQRGSVYLGDQKLPVEVPRVRNVDDDTEVSPPSAFSEPSVRIRFVSGRSERNMPGPDCLCWP